VSALLDFTHPNAVQWFTEQLDRLVRDYGADGFKFDGGGVHFYAGCAGTEGASPKTFAHNPSASPATQSALYAAFALRYKGSENRDGFGFAGKPVAVRLHDKPHTWEALRRLVPDMLAAGLVGCPFICPDMIGGGEWSAFLPGAAFDPELFIRSAQIHALCPMMQISASPWRVLPPELQRVFKEVVSLRQRFAPRFVELAKESARTGEPMMRALEYVFPGRGYAGIKDEFMMGGDLLVAPVVEKGATRRRVVLPHGAWRADDGTLLRGPGELEIDAPLSRLPHFARESV
jgi:alpha-glucosidase